MKPDQIAAVADAVRAGGVPDAVNRWIDMTPEVLAANEKARARIVQQVRDRSVSRQEKPTRSTISAGYARNLDEAGQAILQEIKKAERLAEQERKRQRRENRKGSAMAKSKKKSAIANLGGPPVRSRKGKKGVQAMPAAETEAAPAETASVSINDPALAEQPAAQENAASWDKVTKPKRTRKPKPEAPAAITDAVGVREGSKTALIGEMLLRPEGCTTAEVLVAAGWPSVSMPQQAKACGLALRKEKVKGSPTRYWGVAAAPKTEVVAKTGEVGAEASAAA